MNAQIAPARDPRRVSATKSKPWQEMLSREQQKWDKTDTMFMETLYPILAIDDLCRLFSRSRKSIYNKANVMGLKRAPRPEMTDAEVVRNALIYDQQTGLFTWARSWRGRTMRRGAVAGSKSDNGYLRIRTLIGEHYAHRLAFLYVTGDWPPDEVDHINGVRDDNRWVNLRAATRAENLRNCAGHPGRRVSPFKGVTTEHRSKRFKAQITVNGETIKLGHFDQESDAAIAYRQAAVALHGEFAKW